VLDLRIYDTQCGAKLFRATPELARVLATSFQSRWIFDVEIIARFAALRRLAMDASLKGTSAPPSVEASIYEYPLEQWEDIAGSKLKFRHQVSALQGLACIWWKYQGPRATFPGDGAAPAGAAASLWRSPGPEGHRARLRAQAYVGAAVALAFTATAGLLGLRRLRSALRLAA